MRMKRIIIVLCINCAVCLASGALLYSITALGEYIRERKEASDAPEGKKEVVAIDLQKKTLMDREKTMESVNVIKKSYSKVKTGNPHVYTQLPEGEFAKSVFSFFFLSHMLSSKEVILNDELVDQFKKQGILVYTMDKKYPFMKKSIYIDKSHKSFNKPTLRPGTNIIIVFVESFSQFFLKDDIHGIKGLTDNFKEMGRESYSFTRMYNTSYPTIKGLISALGSSIYLLDESVGGTRIPIPCRFLFLSNITKKLNYTNIHIQAGSERFIGMKNFFIEREGYDYFYGSESLALDKISRLESGFGVDDEKVFDYTIEWLEKYPGNKPFLLTISTINSHPPYKGRYKHPQADGNEMLNGLYSTDKAFGTFWKYFKKSKYRNNTMVIVTADHAMGNSNEYIRFVKNFEDYYHPFFDYIPCFIYFPGGAWKGATNDTMCLNIDITPTILDMMNIDLANPFMGMSIFSDRPYYSTKSKDNKGVPNKGLDMNVKLDEKDFNKVKMLIGFYLNIYREDRMLPKNYTVQLY